MLENFIEEEGNKSREKAEILNLNIKDLEDQVKLLINDLEANKSQLEFTEEGWTKAKEERDKI